MDPLGFYTAAPRETDKMNSFSPNSSCSVKKEEGFGIRCHLGTTLIRLSFEVQIKLGGVNANFSTLPIPTRHGCQNINCPRWPYTQLLAHSMSEIRSKEVRSIDTGEESFLGVRVWLVSPSP
jgi:hypothetical protein